MRSPWVCQERRLVTAVRQFQDAVICFITRAFLPVREIICKQPSSSCACTCFTYHLCKIIMLQLIFSSEMVFIVLIISKDTIH